MVYLIAFLSLYHQLPGLYSTNGILPVDNLISFNPKNPVFQSFIENPNLLILFKCKFLFQVGELRPERRTKRSVDLLLLIFFKDLGFSTFESLEISCLAGILISIETVLHSGNTKKGFKMMLIG